MDTDDGYLVPNPEFFENKGGLNESLALNARLSLSRPNPQEIPTFGPKLEGANALGQALGISELDSTPYADGFNFITIRKHHAEAAREAANDRRSAAEVSKPVRCVLQQESANPLALLRRASSHQGTKFTINRLTRSAEFFCFFVPAVTSG